MLFGLINHLGQKKAVMLNIPKKCIVNVFPRIHPIAKVRDLTVVGESSVLSGSNLPCSSIVMTILSKTTFQGFMAMNNDISKRIKKMRNQEFNQFSKQRMCRFMGDRSEIRGLAWLKHVSKK